MYKFKNIRDIGDSLFYYSGGSIRLDRMGRDRASKWEAVERDLKSYGYSPMEYVHYLGFIREYNDIGTAILTHVNKACSSAFFDEFLGSRETRKDHVKLICRIQREDAYRRASKIMHKYEVFTSKPKLHVNNIMLVEINLEWKHEIPNHFHAIIEPVWTKTVKLLEGEPEYLGAALTPCITEHLEKQGVIVKK